MEKTIFTGDMTVCLESGFLIPPGKPIRKRHLKCSPSAATKHETPGHRHPRRNGLLSWASRPLQTGPTGCFSRSRTSSNLSEALTCPQHFAQAVPSANSDLTPTFFSCQFLQGSNKGLLLQEAFPDQLKPRPQSVPPALGLVQPWAYLPP